MSQRDDAWLNEGATVALVYGGWNPTVTFAKVNRVRHAIDKADKAMRAQSYEEAEQFLTAALAALEEVQGRTYGVGAAGEPDTSREQA